MCRRPPVDRYHSPIDDIDPGPRGYTATIFRTESSSEC